VPNAADWPGNVERETVKPSTIAIVGMAGRFPGARNVQQFWLNLRNGVESIRSFSDEELLAAGVSREDLALPEYVKRASVLGDVPMFDAPFFGLSPRDAAIPRVRVGSSGRCRPPPGTIQRVYWGICRIGDEYISHP